MWYLEGILERLEASASFVELAWISEKQRQSSKLLESGSFDVHKNTVIPMIVMLGHLESDMEVSDIDMENIESNDCKEMAKSDRDANGVLATTWEGARFSYKDGWKFNDLFTQSISELCQVSQLYPRTKE